MVDYTSVFIYKSLIEYGNLVNELYNKRVIDRISINEDINCMRFNIGNLVCRIKVFKDGSVTNYYRVASMKESSKYIEIIEKEISECVLKSTEENINRIYVPSIVKKGLSDLNGVLKEDGRLNKRLIGFDSTTPAAIILVNQLKTIIETIKGDQLSARELKILYSMNFKEIDLMTRLKVDVMHR